MELIKFSKRERWCFGTGAPEVLMYIQKNGKLLTPEQINTIRNVKGWILPIKFRAFDSEAQARRAAKRAGVTEEITVIGIGG